MAEIATIDYTLGQDNVQVLGLDIHNPVFVVSSLTVIAFVAGVLAFQAEAAVAFEALRAWLLSTFDWVFMGVGNFFVLFCLLLVATPLGRVRLGGADARPDYSRSAWFAMLFAAGIGIGLMFFGCRSRWSISCDRRSGSRRPTRRRRALAWPAPSTTGASMGGPCTRWWRCRSPSRRTTSACR